MNSIGDHIRGGINQTSFMFGAVMFAYLFFITVRGDLPKWLALFYSGSASSGSGSTAPAVAALGAGNAGSSGGGSAANGLPALPALPGIGGA